MSLLPYNSTKFERDIEKAIAYNLAVELLHGFKFKNIGSNVTLSLAWEYSLAQIQSAYNAGGSDSINGCNVTLLDEFAERVLKGLEFHRLRGTPISLRNALSWYGFDDIIIEEEVPGEHFAEFQIGIKEIPNGFVPDPVISVSAFAAPLRSRLSRMYNELYDERRLILDDSFLDEELLSDDSGTRLTENGPKLSFGRINSFAIEIPASIVFGSMFRDHFLVAKNVDTYKLDFANLDDGPIDAINWKSIAEREHSVFNFTLIGEIPSKLFECRRSPIASIILSEDEKLDDLNTNFSGGYDELDEAPFVLSFSFLSENRTAVRRVIIDERILREKNFQAISDFEYAVSDIGRELERVIEFEYGDISAVSILERTRFVTMEYKGADTWRDHRHFSIPWNKCSEFTPILEALE